MIYLPTPLKPQLEIGMGKDQKIMAYIPKRLKKLHVQSCFHDSDGYWVYFDNFVWNTLYDGASVCEDTIKELKETLKCCKVCGIQDKPIKLQGFNTDMYCLDYDKNVLAQYQVNSIVVYGFGCELTIALNINYDKALIDLIEKSKYFEFKHTHKKFKLENKTVNMNNSIAYFDFAEIVL